MSIATSSAHSLLVLWDSVTVKQTQADLWPFSCPNSRYVTYSYDQTITSSYVELVCDRSLRACDAKSFPIETKPVYGRKFLFCYVVLKPMSLTMHMTCDRVFSLWHCCGYSARWSAVWIRLWRWMAFRLLRIRFVQHYRRSARYRSSERLLQRRCRSVCLSVCPIQAINSKTKSFRAFVVADHLSQLRQRNVASVDDVYSDLKFYLKIEGWLNNIITIVFSAITTTFLTVVDQSNTCTQ